MTLEPELEQEWRGCIFTIQQQVFQFLTIHNVLIQKELQLRKEAEIRRRRVHRYRRKVVSLASQALLMSSENPKIMISRPIRKTRILSKRKKKPYSRKHEDWETAVAKYSDKKFKETFRISRKTFQFLLNRLSHMKKQPNCRGTISLSKRIAVAIYMLGNPGKYAVLSKLFGLARTTVGQFLQTFCKNVCANLQNEFLNAYPLTEENVENVVEGFRKMGLPQCYGAINYFHFEMRVCKGQNFENSERYGSVVFLAAVDSNKRFTYIDTYGKGSETADDLFQKSSLKQEHLSNLKKYSKTINGKNIPLILVGDESFQMSNIILKPYQENSENLSISEKEFNRVCKRCSDIVEETFDQLIARFRRFGKQIDFSVENIAIIIKACAILHNLCLEQEDFVLPEWTQTRLHEKETDSKSQPKSVFTGEDLMEGIQIRNLISSLLQDEPK